MPDQVACFIELENGWGRRAALGARRLRRRAHFLRLERALAMNDPYMVARIRSDSDHTAHHPVVGQRLHLLVRVPLKAMRDVDFPIQERGNLDLVKLAPLLPDAATIWIADLIEIYEGETRLPTPSIVATQISIESDRSFASYEEALAHVNGPKLANEANVFWSQVLLDV